MNELFFVERDVRLSLFYDSVIHEVGRKLFTTKIGCAPVSNWQLVVNMIFATILIDPRAQHAVLHWLI